MPLVILFLVVLAPSLSWALGDQEVLYVRPAGACAQSGNGKAYACAASAGALGAWIDLSKPLWSATDGTNAQVDPNDILYVCGAHLVAGVSTRLRPTVDGNGTDGAIITDGACPNDPGSIDGQDAHARIVWWDSRLYHTLKNITVKRANGSATDYALSGYDSAQQDRDRFLTLDHVTLRDNINVVATAWFWGAHITVIDSIGINNDADYFYFKGGRDVTFERNSCTEMGGPADCFQQDSTSIASTGTVKVNENHCVKDGIDIKYCFLVGPVNGPTEVIGNYAECPVASVDPSGCSPILVDFKVTEGDVTTAEVHILRNTTKKGWRGITVFRGIPDVRGELVGNVIDGAGTLGVWLASTVDHWLIANNTFVNNGLLNAAGTALSGQHAIYLGKFVNPNGTSDVAITNNILANNHSGLYYTGSLGTAPSHNAYFGQAAINIEKAGNGSQALEASALTADPLFRNAAAGQYQLQGSSPLRSAGVLVAECVSLDGQGCTSTPDLGAYQLHHGTASGGVLTSAAGPVTGATYVFP